MTTMIGKTFVKTSFRTTASVIALAIASLTVPTLAQAKRMGSGGKSVRPASIGKALPSPQRLRRPPPARRQRPPARQLLPRQQRRPQPPLRQRHLPLQVLQARA